jgi:hypothetical protein
MHDPWFSSPSAVAIFPVAKPGRLGKYFALGLELLMLVRILEPAK